MKTLATMPRGLPDLLFDESARAFLHDLGVDLDGTTTDFGQLPDDVAARVEVLLTGWGSAAVTADVLDRMPRLRAVVHTAGSVQHLLSDTVWQREDILVTTATQINAIPVAEFTLAHILLAGKKSLRQEAMHRRSRGAESWAIQLGGNYRTVVGLIGASRIGRLVAEHLMRFDLRVLISDPYVGAEEITSLGAEKVELDELFRRSDTVSLHAPDVPSTKGMVTAELLALMPDGATFINTARSALVDEDALRSELVSGRISAVLDVHDDLPADDPLWDVETVTITPHIAGSQGNELQRMGTSAVEELRRLRDGEPPLYPVDRSRLHITA